MGCEYCSSGLGKKCDGPEGLDDIECGCNCDCHKCPECYQTDCESIGGNEPCEIDKGDE